MISAAIVIGVRRGEGRVERKVSGIISWGQFCNTVLPCRRQVVDRRMERSRVELSGVDNELRGCVGS